MRCSASSVRAVACVGVAGHTLDRGRPAQEIFLKKSRRGCLEKERAGGPKVGVVFWSKKWAAKNGNPLSVPLFCRPVLGPENDPHPRGAFGCQKVAAGLVDSLPSGSLGLLALDRLAATGSPPFSQDLAPLPRASSPGGGGLACTCVGGGWLDLAAGVGTDLVGSRGCAGARLSRRRGGGGEHLSAQARYSCGPPPSPPAAACPAVFSPQRPGH